MAHSAVAMVAVASAKKSGLVGFDCGPWLVLGGMRLLHNGRPTGIAVDRHHGPFQSDSVWQDRDGWSLAAGSRGRRCQQPSPGSPNTTAFRRRLCCLDRGAANPGLVQLPLPPADGEVLPLSPANPSSCMNCNCKVGGGNGACVHVISACPIWDQNATTRGSRRPPLLHNSTIQPRAAVSPTGWVGPMCRPVPERIVMTLAKPEAPSHRGVECAKGRRQQTIPDRELPAGGEKAVLPTKSRVRPTPTGPRPSPRRNRPG